MAGNRMSNKRTNKIVLNAVATVIVLLLAILVLVPIWWIFRTSLMSMTTVNQYPPQIIPHEWLWSNYSKALELSLIHI